MSRDESCTAGFVRQSHLQTKVKKEACPVYARAPSADTAVLSTTLNFSPQTDIYLYNE